MIAPTLTPSEIAAVRAADKMERVVYRGGSVAATDGRHTLFAAGSAESFDVLWEQAADIRDADAARKEAEARGTISLEELRAEVTQAEVNVVPPFAADSYIEELDIRLDAMELETRLGSRRRASREPDKPSADSKGVKQ